MRRTLVSGSALFLLLALGCPPAADAQTRDDTLVYALQSDVDSWDPPNSVLREAIILGYHVFDHLAVRDLKTRRVVPNLALSWKALNDTTWEVKLRQGVKFHDGSPFTARDVRATFERVLDPAKKMTPRGNHAKIKSVEIDVINKSGQARTASSPILRTAFLQLDQAARSGPNPFTDRRVRQAANLATDMDGIIKHVLNGLGDRVAAAVNPMAFGFDAGLKPYKQDLAAARKLLAEAGYPNGVDIVYNQGPPTVEPGLLQTDEAIVADLTKAGFRVKQNYLGDNTVFVARIKDSKAGPMFSFSWGYYSVFDADAILYDIFKCKETYAYYCNPAMDDLIIQGRSTLDQKKRAEIYAKAQKLAFDDAAYLFKCGLRGVWGISNRVDYQAPPDEVDRMFLVTPRKK